MNAAIEVLLRVSAFTLAALSATESASLQTGAPVEAGAPVQAGAPIQTAATPGKTYFYMRTWPGGLIQFDPATDTVVKSLANKHGLGYDCDLTYDKKRFVMITGQRSFVEVVDVATMEIIDEQSFEEQGFIVRVSDIREQPGGERWYVKVDKVEKKLDQFVIKEPEWIDYDVKEHKAGKRMKELPKAIRRGARVSPDGTKWHVFDKDLTILDPKTLDEIGKIELSKPMYSGLGPISIRGDDFFENKNPDAYRFMYTMRDPVNKNRTMCGLVDIDIAGMKIGRVVEWGAAPRAGNLHYTQDHRLGVGQARSMERRSQADGRDPEITLYSFDLETGKKIKETRVEVRNGLSIGAISPDGSKIYLDGRGNQLVVYDRDHKYLKTIELPGDSDGQIMTVTQ